MLCIENDASEHGMVKFREKPDQLSKIVKKYGSKVTLDTGYAGSIGMLEEFSALENIEVLHLHDNHGEKDEHLALGDGNIDFCSFLGLMKNKRWVVEVKNIPDIVKSWNYLKEKDFFGSTDFFSLLNHS